MGLIKGAKIWRYVAEGEIPPEVESDAHMKAIVQNSISWSDAILPVIRGRMVTIHELTPDELAQRRRELGNIS